MILVKMLPYMCITIALISLFIEPVYCTIFALLAYVYVLRAEIEELKKPAQQDSDKE